jgi:elongation factor 1-alpha
LLKPSGNILWYEGPTLIQALNNLAVPTRYADKPLRIPIQDVYKIHEIGTVPAGRIYTGTMKKGMMVTIAPPSIIAEVTFIEIYSDAMTEVPPGYNIGFSLRNVTSKDISWVCMW